MARIFKGLQTKTKPKKSTKRYKYIPKTELEARIIQTFRRSMSMDKIPAKTIETVFHDRTICPRCGKEITYNYVPDRGILPSSKYDLIADTIWHSKCWDAQMLEFPP